MAEQQAPEAYRFGPFRFECATGRLYRGDTEVSLPPRASVLLEHLLESAGQVCSKQELMDLVWADVHVGEESLTQAISLIRQALDDDARRPTFVETIQRRGYRFIGEVEREVSDPSTAAADRPFGNYEIVERVGVGGMGRVYRARDLRLDREVAIKVLPGELLDDDKALRRFEREAKLLASMNHPNVATLHSLEESAEQQFLVMELVEGQTLAQRLASGPLPVTEALEICRQVAGALEAAHAKGIVHRDLKPSNVMITGEEAVKILDFGVAKALDLAGPDQEATGDPTKLTSTGLAVGTPPYMSPEQVQGEAVDERADLWALGCLLYETLAGKRAFEGDTAASTAASILGEEPRWEALPEAVPLRVRLLLDRCLKKDPHRRLHHAADARIEIEEALSEVSEAGGVEAPVVLSGSRPGTAAAGPPEPAAAAGTPRWSRRQLLAGGAVAAGLGAGAGLAVGSLTQGPRRPAAPPTYQRLTFRRGMIRTARFAPDHETVLYGALWDGDVCRTYGARLDSPESAPWGDLPPATPLAVSSSGKLALALGTHFRGVMTYGTLARVTLTGGAPREMAEQVKYADWTPDGSELALVRRTREGERLEFPQGEVVAEGDGYSFPRVSPRGDRVAFFELTGPGSLTGRVVTVDRAGERTVLTPQYFNVFGLAWNGDEVWYTAAAERWLFRDVIFAVGPDREVRVVATIPGNASLHDITPDGSVLMAHTDDRAGIAVLPPGEDRERDLSWLDAPSLDDISRDGSKVLFTERGVGGGPARSVYLRDSAGSEPPVPLGDGVGVALSPDNTWAIVAESSPGRPTTHLDVIPTGPGDTVRIEHPGFSYGGAAWLPDGERFIVRARGQDGQVRIYVVELDGGTIEPIASTGVAPGPAMLSPDGTELAVVEDDGVELHPVSDDGAHTNTGIILEGRPLAWIEGGLLVSENPGSLALNRIFQIDLSSGRRDLWTEIQPRDPTGIMNVQSFAVTPDGSSYGYRWHRALSDLYLVDDLR